MNRGGGARPGWQPASLGDGLTLACAVVLAAVALAPAASASTLRRGFADDVYFNAGAKTWVKRTVAAGASRVSLEIDWANVEPKKPKPRSHAASPNNAAYNFGYVDAVVREFAKTGVQPVFLVTDAPRWAEAKGGTKAQEASGGYMPNDTAFRELARALAQRYSGHFPDPAYPRRKRGQRHYKRHYLPRVKYFEVWAEANLGVHLAPQWTKEHGHWANTGPKIYRGLLNAFYTGVHRSMGSDIVLTTGLAPYGDPPGGSRTPPVQFLENLLCLNTKLVRQSCPEPTHFDVIASDPYEVGSPTTLAAVGNDASAPDLDKLTKVVHKAVSAGTALPRKHKQLWVTEFSYDSRPPNPHAISTATQARWMDEAFYVFWREGASAAIWYLIRDQTGNFSTRYFSGVYFHNGKSKPSLVAYRFPFVVMKNPLTLGTLRGKSTRGGSAKTATVWGIAPQTGTVKVQRKVGHGWRTVFSTHVRGGNVFVRDVSASLTGDYRAVEGHGSSLVWKYEARAVR